MKTVKAKIKGTSAVLEGCLCDDSFFVSVDHDTFERYDLDEVEICKEPVSEDLKEAAEEYSKRVSDGHNYRDLTCGFIAGAEWRREQPSEGLDEAAIDYADYARKQPKDYAISSIADYDHGCIDGFKAGSEWRYQKDRREFAKLKAKEWSDGYDEGIAKGKEQMLKDAVEGEVCILPDGFPYFKETYNKSLRQYILDNFKSGDKVKIVVVKEDKK